MPAAPGLSEEDTSLHLRSIGQLEDQIVHHLPQGNLPRDIGIAIRRVPRHLFVHPAYRYMAYTDNALPTRRGQTTSAPSVIAEMIRLAGVRRGDSVLEIGTGTGYEAAILHEMGIQVHTVEIDKQLAGDAVNIFETLKYQIDVHQGNGLNGLAECAPFQGIIVAAAVSSLSPLSRVRQQLRNPGGTLVAPVGARYEQKLTCVYRRKNGYSVSCLEGWTVSFVPLLG